MSIVCQSYVLVCYSYVIRMSHVCTRMLFVCHSYQRDISLCSYVFVNHLCVLVCIRMSLVYTRMALVCYSYVLVCHSYVLVYHPYVTRTYLYVTRMSLVCHSYVICMSLVCGFTMNSVTFKENMQTCYFANVIKNYCIYGTSGETQGYKRVMALWFFLAGLTRST